jgi:rare lipoprotein A
MRWRAVAVVVLVAGMAACSLRSPKPPPVVGGRQEGVASWYGPGFHGRRTANGEVYDQYELTAAHPSLPLGSRAVVTSLTNGRSVEVRINDRGPFVGGRIVDLSYAAARVIGMIGPGVVPVRLEVIEEAPARALAGRGTAPPVAIARARKPTEPTARTPEPPAPTPATAPAPEGAFAVVVATLSDPAKAEHLRSRIALKFPDAHVSALDAGADRYYRVRIGPYPARGVAVARAELVNRYGYPAVITEE